MRLKLPPAILALIAAAAGLALAVHYPLAPAVMTAVVLVCWAAVFARPHLWLLVLPALLPVIGLAPWTGWITFEEQDILILAVAVGGYARMAWPSQVNLTVSGGMRHHPQGRSVRVWLLAGLFALATAVAMYRGFADAGGFSFGWFQGYHEPMNSLRLGKSFFEALLLLPLWRVIYRQNPERAQSLLSQGLMLGLAAASLATLWERLAFTGLLNFSSDYRTTGLFWEMHVGGAALDGFLALTVPFALRELLLARTPARWSVAATVLALAAYACLTTFSRGVYLAIPIGLVVYFILTARQRQSELADQQHGLPRFARNDVKPSSSRGRRPWRSMHWVPGLPRFARNDESIRGLRAFARNDGSEVESCADRPSRPHPGWLAGVLLVAGFGVGAAWMFQTSGYRGMAALLATVALMLPLARVLRGFNLSQWLLSFALSFLLVLLAGAIGWLVPKGAYVAWGLAVALTALMLGLLKHGTQAASFAGPMAFGGFSAALTGTALVEDHWGETEGLLHAAPVLLALLGVCLWAGAWRKPLWSEALRWQATAAGAMGAVAAIIGIFGGGSYMSDRFLTGGQDFGGRVAHWQLGRDMLRTQADWLLGKGLGRFPANYFLAGNPQEHPGDYRLKNEGENTYLTLTGGLHNNSWGSIFRVTQRVAEPGKSAVVTTSVRAEKDVSLHFEVCEKHLLYGQGCVGKEVRIKAAPGVWQAVRLELQGDGATRGDWYAPRLLAFSMAMESRGGMAELDDVALTGTGGRQLLANGGFSEGMAHWFFSSDRHHMPWHIKSMFMNVLFDQGIVGATLWGLLLAGALWRTGLGTARHHPLAPALAAGLTGFAVVGLFDSLLDVPRVAFLFYFLLLVGLTIRSPHHTAHDNTAVNGKALQSKIKAMPC